MSAAVGPVVGAAVSTLRGQRFAPGVVNTAAEIARVTLAKRRLPGAVGALLGSIHVIGRRQQRIGAQAGDAIGLIDHAMRNQLHAAHADEGGLYHQRRRQLSLDAQAVLHRIGVLYIRIENREYVDHAVFDIIRRDYLAEIVVVERPLQIGAHHVLLR